MLTDTAIRKAKPAASPLKLSDGGGMYLLVKPDGGKYWRMNYRFGGKQKTLSFGVYPTVTLADARQRREDARKLLANDSDPSEVRKVIKAERIEAAITAADTFEIVAREWMARQEVAEITKGKNEWLLGHLFPSIGKRPIAGITARELLAVLREIEATGKIETANRVKVKAGQVFRYAVLEGKADADLTASLRGALKSLKNKHHAAVTDPTAIGGLLRAIDGFAGQFSTQQALKLAPLVPARVLPMDRRLAALVSKLVNAAGRALPMHKAQQLDAAWQYMAAVTRQGADGLPLGESLRTITGRFGIGYGTAQRMLRKMSEVNPRDWSSEALDMGTGWPRWRYVREGGAGWLDMKEKMDVEQITQHEAEKLARKIGALMEKATPAAVRLAVQMLGIEEQMEAVNEDTRDFAAATAESMDF